MEKNKNNIIKSDYIIMAGILFLIIFNPPIRKGISFTIIFVIWSTIEIFLHYQYVKTYVISTEIYIMIKRSTIFLFYFILVGLINSLFQDKATIIIYNIIKCIGYNIAIIAVSIYLAYRIYIKKYTLIDVMKVYVLCGFIQSILSLLSYFIPSIRIVLTSIMVSNVNHSNISELVYWSVGVRCFGFASTLFDIFGCAMSIIAILALNLGISVNKKYLISFILISFSAIINARTSVILIVTGAVILIMSRARKTKTIQSLGGIIFVVIIFCVGSVVVYNYVANSSLTISAARFVEGIDSIKSLLFKGEFVGYFDTLFNQFIFIPDNIINVIFGTAMLPIEKIQRNSDIGYIQDVWKYGVAGSIMQYSIYVYMFREANRKVREEYPGLISSIGVIVILYMIKLNCLGYSMASVIFIPLIFCSFITFRKNKM